MNRHRIIATQTRARDPSGLRDVYVTFHLLESMAASCCAADADIIFNRSRLQEIATVYFSGAAKLSAKSAKRL